MIFLEYGIHCLVPIFFVCDTVLISGVCIFYSEFIQYLLLCCSFSIVFSSVIIFLFFLYLCIHLRLRIWIFFHLRLFICLFIWLCLSIFPHLQLRISFLPLRLRIYLNLHCLHRLRRHRLHLCLRLKILLFIRFYVICFIILLLFILAYGIHNLIYIIFNSWDYLYLCNLYIDMVSVLNTSHLVARLVLFSEAS